MDPPLRLQGPAPRPAVPDARRAAVTEQPAPPVGQPATQPNSRGHRGDGDLAERQVPVRRTRGRHGRRHRPSTRSVATSSSSASRTRRSPAARGSTTSRTPPTSWPTWRALDRHHLVLIERDGGRGLTALFRNVYVVDLRDVDAAGFVEQGARRRPHEDPRPGPRVAPRDPCRRRRSRRSVPGDVRVRRGDPSRSDTIAS